MKKISLIALTIISLVAMLPAKIEAFACIYMWESIDQEVQYELRASELVFMGEVIRIAKIPDNVPTRSLTELLEENQLEELFLRHRVSVTFRVDEVWKGNPAETVDVVTWDTAKTDAGYSFAIGRKYLVFTNPWRGIQTAGECSLIRPTERSDDILKIIGKGRTPQKKGS